MQDCTNRLLCFFLREVLILIRKVSPRLTVSKVQTTPVINASNY